MVNYSVFDIPISKVQTQIKRQKHASLSCVQIFSSGVHICRNVCVIIAFVICLCAQFVFF